MNYFRRACSTLLNALLPQTCAVCQHVHPDGAAVCGHCHATLPALPSDRCPRCADTAAAQTLCGHCAQSLPAFDGVLAPFRYAPPVDQLVLGLKHRHELRLARWLGQRVFDTLRHTATPRFDRILPMPLHPARLRTRGFNQSLEMARVLSGALALPLDTRSVTRNRDTQPQAELDRQARQRNVQHAFDAHQDFTGARLLIVDDVMTTGSSAHEVARILKLHGAEQVWVAVAARVMRS